MYAKTNISRRVSRLDHTERSCNRVMIDASVE